MHGGQMNPSPSKRNHVGWAGRPHRSQCRAVRGGKRRALLAASSPVAYGPRVNEYPASVN